VRQIGNWLISTLAWGPLLLWVTWPRFDARLAWHPLVGYSGIIALLLSWAYSGRFGITHRRWPAIAAVLVTFGISFVVAAQSANVGIFTALSVGVGTLMSSIVCGLIVVVSVRVNQVRNYGALEDAILLVAPMIVAAAIAGVTSGALVTDAVHILVVIVASLFAGAVVAIFVLAWIYAAIGIASSWAAKRSVGLDQVRQKRRTVAGPD
jgi:hypothetical protein